VIIALASEAAAFVWYDGGESRGADHVFWKMSVWVQIALCSWLLAALNTFELSQVPANCKGPAELERVLATQPSAGAYDALGAYFGQRQELACAIAAFEAAVHQDPNSWEARFNLSLALLQNMNPPGPFVN
jgi:tetratricopeptide (TPR) repeat protein